MDAKTLAKATEPFFSTKEIGKGTGLGLSMIHGLAVQLNGALRLSSELGRGTVAEIWVPVTAEPAPEATPALAAIEDAPRVTILVVDDDALISMSTVDMLEDLGHEVIEANSGDRALEILENNRVDLLITDFSMPKMNGAQLAVAAREINPGLPILLASGYAELPANINIELPRIAKPYQQSQLATEIARVLKVPAHVAAAIAGSRRPKADLLAWSEADLGRYWKGLAMAGKERVPGKATTPAERAQAMDDLTRSIATAEAVKLQRHRDKTERLRQARLARDAEDTPKKAR